ncbi:hypothetical protein B0H19DRAFT_1081056 [Mycena capillaripes]|nr:hypothetical protein B0H19DRAFT_1081056 [Mycena capillaripes]
MENSAITTVNAVEELEKAEKLLKDYKRKNANQKSKAGGSDYKDTLEDRITASNRVIEESTMGLIQPTLSGSPNDPVPPPGQVNDNLNAPVAPAGTIDQPRGNASGADNQGSTQMQGPPIDPSLMDSQGPSAKRSRTNQGPIHRKIGTLYYLQLGVGFEPFTVEVDPMVCVTESINARMMSSFLIHWLKNGAAVESADPSSTADTFPGLRDAASEIIDHISYVIEKNGLNEEELNWKLDANGPLNTSHLVALQIWLVSCDLMVGNLQMKPPPAIKKVRRDDTPVEIINDGELITMTPGMLIEARLDPVAYPGCVEAGLETVKAVFKNRAGRYKCITCDSSAPRGRGLEGRVIPPKADHPYLADCRCPLRGAALELWMIKMTGNNDNIPQRGDDDVKNRRLALNPDLLKLIGGAIEAASGHEVDTLLQPEIERLEHTVHWALKRLHSIASEQESEFTTSFPLLATKLTETMVAFENERVEKANANSKGKGKGKKK